MRDLLGMKEEMFDTYSELGEEMFSDPELYDGLSGEAESLAITFKPRAVETPGGGRIKNKAAPSRADLVTVIGVGGKRIELHRSAAEAWRALVSAARAQGIKEPLLLPVSGYRDPELQRRLWEQ